MLMQAKDQPKQQRILFLLDKWSDKSGKPIEEILGDDNIDEWVDFIRMLTPLDARRTWKQQVPNFEDGTAFRNQPASV